MLISDKENWLPAPDTLMNWSVGNQTSVKINQETRQTAWLFDGQRMLKGNGPKPKLSKIFTDKNVSDFLLQKIKFKNYDLSEILVNSNTNYFKNSEVIFENCKTDRINYLGVQDSHLSFIHLSSQSAIKFNIKDGIGHHSTLCFEGGNFSLIFDKNSHLVGNLTFSNSTFDSFSFSARTFSGSLDIKSSTFRDAPDFKVLEVSQQLSIENNSFKDHRPQSIHRYRHLKKMLQENHDSSQANSFFSHELECRLNGQKWTKNFPEKFVGLFYWILSNYGRSIALPFFILVLSSAFFAAADYYYFFSRKDHFLLYFGHHVIGPFALITDHFNVEYSSLGQQYYRFIAGIWISLSYFFLIFGIRKRFKFN